MKICTEHWAALRKGVQDRGMWHLVAQSGKEAIDQMVDELQGEDTKAQHDPLMAAHWAISGKALEQGGLYLMGRKDDGSDYCPLCEVEAHTEAGMAQKWIDGCLDAQREYCVEIGRLKDTQQ